MTIQRRRLMGAALACTTSTGFPVALAQTPYPSKNIKVIVPNPAGGGTDIMGRMLAEGLSSQLGQPVIVENKAGASGMVAADLVLQAPADGHTFFMVYSGVMTVNGALYKERLRYNPARDFVPVTPFAEVANVLIVKNGLPVKSVAELIKLAKSKPGMLSYASSGNGVSNHLAMELFKQLAGIYVTHIPYRGGAPAMADLIGGQVDMMFNNMAEVSSHLSGGRVRALAVATDKRVPAIPDIPTVGESGLPGYDMKLWYGLVAKAGTPVDVVEKVNAAIRIVQEKPETKTRLAGMGATPLILSPREFATAIAQEQIKWSKVVRDGNITPE